MQETKSSEPLKVPSFIGIRRVIEISGFSKATILRRIKAKDFPCPVIKEKNIARWDLEQILLWRDEQFRKRAEREQTQQVATA